MIEWAQIAGDDDMAQTGTKIGFIVERLAEGRVLAYRFSDIFRPTVDAWAESIRTEYGAWQHDKLRTMLDLRPSGSIISPYAIHSARPLAQLRPELPGRLAVLINNRVAAQIISAAIRANLHANRKRLLFADEPSALAWLMADD
jgi:hypothetical protein